jgi:hypothetical protein
LTETEALKERQKFKNARKRIRRDEEEEEGEPQSRGDDEIPIKKIMRIRSNLKAFIKLYRQVLQSPGNDTSMAAVVQEIIRGRET